MIIGAAPPHDSNYSQGKQMFCNVKTDWLGPWRLQSKAATWVKKNRTVPEKRTAVSPERVIIKDLDEVDVLEDTKRNFHRTKSHATYPHKHVRVFSSDPSKKQPSVISLSSDSTSSPMSNYKPNEDIKIEGSDGGSQASEASAVEMEYEQPSTSCKRKPKVTPPA